VKITWPFKYLLVVALLTTTAADLAQSQESGVKDAAARGANEIMQTNQKKFGLVIHGGAGIIERGGTSAGHEQEYRAGLDRALGAGYEILKGGGSSLDATEAAVRVLEDDPHFNAGKGAVFTNAGTNELDAAIMDGKTLKAGAVANLRHIKNPINLARLVMEKSGHVMMDGEGAEAFAAANGVELVDQKYFYTEERWQALQKMKETEKSRGVGGKKFIVTDQDRHGTVGAVALDKNGNLAAATSTGGTTNKKIGRVGDSPIIGGGTYATNTTCAVSATGDGEHIMGAVAAHEISALIRYRGLTLEDACEAVLRNRLEPLGAEAGLIAVDARGEIAMPFNTAIMHRGWQVGGEEPQTSVGP